MNSQSLSVFSILSVMPGLYKFNWLVYRLLPGVLYKDSIKLIYFDILGLSFSKKKSAQVHSS